MANRLHKVSIFEGLNDVQLSKILEVSAQEDFKKGEYLFRQGEPAQYLFVILRGRIKLVKHAPTGATTIIEIYSIGDELSAAALIEDGPYPASARALTDGVVLKVPKAQFKRFLKEWPQLGYNVMKELGSKYKDVVENLSSLAVYKVEGRICRVMASLARRYGIYGDCRGVILDISLTRQDLADITGTTLETTIRTLNKLRNAGLITWEGKRFFIPDLNALDRAVVR